MGKQTKAAKAALASPIRTVAAPADIVNRTYHEKLQQALDEICDHPLMQDIRTAAPIARGVVDPTTGRAGHKETFNQATLASDLANAGTSESGGNFFWQNPFRPPLAGVPLNSTSVSILVSRNFRELVPFPSPLIVAVPSKDFDAGAHFGDWQFVTPDELIHGYIMAIQRDLGDQQKLKQWRFHILSTTFMFVVSCGEDVYWRQARLREDADVAFRVIVRSALQRIYEVNAVLSRRSGSKVTSHSQLADLYQQHLQQIDSSEKISASFIMEAVKLHKSLLGDEGIVATLTWMDSEWGKASPLNSVTKLAAVMMKSKGKLEQARWVINCIKDRIQSKQVSIHDGFSVEQLTGDRDKSHKGLIDLFIFSKKERYHALSSWPLH